jgi:large subunit ribosomal protein L9
MEVILKEDVHNLGHRGDLVKVAAGYGRNYLLPRKLAVPATDGNRKMVEQQKTASIRKEAVERGDAQKLSEMLAGVQVTVSRKAGEGDQLFGSVTAIDVADALAAKGYQIDRRKIQLDEPLKALGSFDVAVKLHKDVAASVKVHVTKEQEAE